MVEPGYDPNFEPEDPRLLNPEAEAIDDRAEPSPTQDASEDAPAEPPVDLENQAPARAAVEDDEKATVEATGPGVFARVLSATMTAASFAAVRGAGLVYHYPRAALASGLSVVVLGGVLMVRSDEGGKAPVTQIPGPAVEDSEKPVETAETNPETGDEDEGDEPEETLAAPAPVADLADPAPAIEAEPPADDEFPAIDAVKLTSGASSFDLPALPELGEEAPAPAPTIALAAANLKLGEGPEDDPPPPAPAPAPEATLDEAEEEPAPAPEVTEEEPAPAPDLAPEPDPAPAPAPALEEVGEEPDPAPAPTPLSPPTEAMPAPAPDLDPIAAPDPTPALGEDHGLLEIPSLDDLPVAPAMDPAPEPEPEPKPEPESEPATVEAPQVAEPKPSEGAAAGLGAGLGAAFGALTGAALGDQAGGAETEAKPVEPPTDLDQAPLPPAEPDEPLVELDEPPAEPSPSQSMPTAPDDLPVFRAVPSSPASAGSGLDRLDAPAAPAAPTPVPSPAPAPSMADEAESADEPDREGWVTIKRSASAAYMLRDLDRDEPYLDDDFGPRGFEPNPDPDAHADRAMEFEIHQPFRDEPRAPAQAVDDGTMDTVLHRVEPGENFWTISRTYYTSGRYYRALGQANADQFERLEDLYVGAVIRVPPPEDLDPAYIDPPPARAARNQNPLVAETNSRAGGGDDDPDAGAVPIRRAGRSELELHLPIADPRAERVSDEPSRARLRGEPEVPSRRNASRPVHKVRPRETLRTIARDRLGDARRADEILELNRQVIDDPYQLIVGQVLELPDDARAARGR